MIKKIKIKKKRERGRSDMIKKKEERGNRLFVA